MKTNSKIFMTRLKNYMLDCIDFSGYDDSLTDTFQAVYDTFMSEYGNWNIQQHKGNKQKYFAEWLQGLPSCFTIAFYNWEILQLAKTWGSLPENASEKQENKILENYWNFMSYKFFQLLKKEQKENESKN